MAKGHISSLLAAILIIFFSSPLATAARYNVLNYGAKPDGRTDSTQAFLAAWTQACESIMAATVHVPPGRFFLQNVAFQGPCKNNAILFRVHGTLVAPSDYTVIGNTENWIFFQYVNGVTVSGGVLDGQGPGLSACKASGMNCPSGATSLGFCNSNNIVISGLTSLNSQLYHIVINGCQNVKVHSVTVSASGHSPNTDGIHVQLSSGVTILKSRIRTGDDCVSIGAGTTNLWTENVACGSGHGISIGSLGKDLQEPGVQNVTVKSVTFTGTQNGLRIRSWGRPSSGFNSIVIDQNYCPDNQNCPGQESGVKISDVTYQDIRGTSATEVAIKFDCSKKNPCSGIKLKDVKLNYKNQPADASCDNADGTAFGFIQPSSCL
ncbi:hypothetical protein P3X46_017020 [Hevea brasiliensis]|uniref:Polygalacturonase n=1 Tax=Hevea brasiliensis TaxID=3981 RepID=A0ABQ9M375_HEVBR|nr:hypothetical protein P3X46_017020 [Hevea brasiliensis]